VTKRAEKPDCRSCEPASPAGVAASQPRPKRPQRAAIVSVAEVRAGRSPMSRPRIGRRLGMTRGAAPPHTVGPGSISARRAQSDAWSTCADWDALEKQSAAAGLAVGHTVIVEVVWFVLIGRVALTRHERAPALTRLGAQPKRHTARLTDRVGAVLHAEERGDRRSAASLSYPRAMVLLVTSTSHATCRRAYS
jgi:hypothetical protein